MEKNYNHHQFEDDLYASWESSGAMRANEKSEKPPFAIVLPPPNVTGVLHMGHACMLAIEDIFVRHKKMTGHEVLWVPGTDHAAIATENVVLRELGIQKREMMTREDFLDSCRKFAAEKHDRIVGQTKKMGSWLDWSREAYTLDEEREFAVQKMFQMLWDDGLIVRGYRMVNWSVGAQSVLADDEVEFQEKEGVLAVYRYELTDGSGELHVATTRPETLFGDSAVAIHPDDKRAKTLKGKTVKVPFSGRIIPIICDDYVDQSFGTATLKVTPAHDPNDFEIGKRHDLPQIQVIGFDGIMKVCDEVPVEFQGKSREECRKELLKENTFLVEKKKHIHSVGHCYRSGTVIEPMISKQWFIAVNNEFFIEEIGKTTLKKLTLEAVKDGEIEIIPSRFEKTYYQWIENLRDWCISRQIWWGHQIPVWYDETGKEYMPREQKFIWARHGETDANTKHLVQSQDDALNRKGEEQAKHLAETLKAHHSITRIITSPSKRALQTATIVGEILGLPVETIDELRAIDFGSITGNYYASGTAIEHALEAKTGEAPEAVLDRVQKGWDRLKTESTEGDILLVGHRSILSALENIRKGKTDAHSLIQNRAHNEEKPCGIWKKVSVFQAPQQEGLTQDPDTLDTWFSSALWPLSTLGWPNTESLDFQKFYPNQLMETGHDILFFWVARMVMFGKYATGKAPFSHVYLHGMVTDENGQKMSKSKGNGIDPLDMIQEYGADAVRLSLVIGTSAGNSMALGTSKVSGYRNFVNKIWNAGRFVQMQIEDIALPLSWDDLRKKRPEPKSQADQWIATRLSVVSAEIQKSLESYEISKAGDLMYHFVWDDFCDWYIEASKVEKNPEFLYWVFCEILVLVHPFCPFITEVLFQMFWGQSASIMDTRSVSSLPQYKEATELFRRVQESVGEIRKCRSENKINPKERISIKIETQNPDEIEQCQSLIEALGMVTVTAIGTAITPAPTDQKILSGIDILYVNIPINTEALEKEYQALQAQIQNLEARLGNTKYVEKAPKALVDQTKKELEDARTKLANWNK